MREAKYRFSIEELMVEIRVCKFLRYTFNHPPETRMIKANVLAVAMTCILGATQLQAGEKCDLDGAYGYVYQGASYDGAEAVEIAETGSFSVGKSLCGSAELCGTAKATFRFPSFTIDGVYSGPLWALIQLDFEGLDHAISADIEDPCQGTIAFEATGTVIKSEPVDLPGFPLFSAQERSIAYTISGKDGEIVDLISTSPGSVLSGTAKAQ